MYLPSRFRVACDHIRGCHFQHVTRDEFSLFNVDARFVLHFECLVSYVDRDLWKVLPSIRCRSNVLRHLDRYRSDCVSLSLKRSLSCGERCD